MLKPLTALRFFAALLVFAYHCPLTGAGATYYRTGEAGVEFFFVLSGFILIYAHRELFESSADLAQMKSFWVARFARIYPVHLLAFALAMYMVVRSEGAGWFTRALEPNSLALLTQLTLTQSWVRSDSLVNFNTPAWSLSDEAFFYALFPVLAVALFAMAQRTKVWSVAMLAVLLWTGAVILAAVVPDYRLLYAFPPIRLLDFAFGACLGVVFINARRSTLGFGIATALEVAALAGFAAGLFLTPHVPGHLRYTSWVAPFAGFAIYTFAQGGGAISKALSAQPFVYLGEISYSFYMLHLLIVVWILSDFHWIAPAAVSTISLILCIAISVVVFERYEKPLRRRIRGYFTSAAPSAAAAA